MKRSVYDLLYRFGAPWDGPPRADLVRLVETGVVTPTRLAPGRAIDLGCGTGANVRYLAEHGFDAVGVDYSRVALEIARKRAADAGTPASARFVEGDITADRVAGVEGVFDLVLDFGTLDDLDAGRRRSMARLVANLARPGALFLFWCFWADRAALPRMRFTGPSRMTPVIEPGEEADLFAEAFSIERLTGSDPSSHTAFFLMTRR
jgi:SAM-dependent methyltransferase